MLNELSIDNLELKGKKALVRVDFNVPITNGKIGDDWRIQASIPTIEKILDDGGIAILMSHLGRPKGKKDKSLSLEPVAQRLSELLGKKVKFVDDCIGDKVKKVIENAQPGNCILLENLRFHKEEKANDTTFAKELASLADVYIDDAFATAHRAHASTVGVVEYFDQVAAGYLLLKELDKLGYLLRSPEHPFIAVIGGLKISTKIKLLRNLLPKVDKIIIGGAMSYTFFKALGLEVGVSPYEQEFVEEAKSILQDVDTDTKLLLPVDVVVTNSIDNPTKIKSVSWESIPQNMTGVDIGDNSINLFTTEIGMAQTLFINGPMGVFEKEEFQHGTRSILQAFVKATDNGAYAVAGGGDTLAALGAFNLRNKLSWESTGGGASLTLLEGSPLPAVKALEEKIK